MRRVRRQRSNASAGSATLEYVAVLALAGLLIGGALALPVAAPRLADLVSRTVCLVESIGGGAGSCAPTEQPPTTTTAPPPFDPKPTKCKINESSEKAVAEGKIDFFKFGQNAALVQATYTDETVTYTATDGTELGVTGGFGGKIAVDKLQRADKVDFGAGLKVDYGSTWTFENQAEADAMRAQLEKYLAEQRQLNAVNPGLEGAGGGGGNLGMWMYHMIVGFTDPPKPPNQQVGVIEVKGDAGYKLGLNKPLGTSGKIPALKLSEFGEKFGLSGKWTTVHDTEKATTTYTVAGETTGEYNGTVGPLGGDLKGVLGSSLAWTRDKDNQLTKITLVTTTEGKGGAAAKPGQKDLGGQVTDSHSEGLVDVSTTTLDITDESQRALAESWLASVADDPRNAVAPATFYPDRLAADDPFQNLMYQQGRVSDVRYDKVTDKQGFAAEVKAGVSLGIDFSVENSDSRALSASYLGVPQSDGRRAPVDFGECVSH